MPETPLNTHGFVSSLYITFGKGLGGAIGGFMGFASSVLRSDGHSTTKHALDLSLNVVPACCLCYFGWQVVLLQTPFFKSMRSVMEIRQDARRAHPSLATIIGQGAFLVAGGAMPVILMPFRSLAAAIGGGMDEPTSSTSSSSLLRVIPRRIGCYYVVGIGLCTMLVGFMKSLKLEKVRAGVAHAFENGTGLSLYQSCARAEKEKGLTGAEFNDMSLQLKGISWTDVDCRFIFSALAKDSPFHLSYAELEMWATSRFMTLL